MLDTPYVGASGTKGPIIKDSGGVSKTEDKEIESASPTKKMEELDTPKTRILSTHNCLFTTVKFILSLALLSR